METRKMKLALSAGALALSLALAGCGGGGSAQMPADPPPPTPYEVAQTAIMTAATTADAQAAVATAVAAGITGEQLQSLNMAVATRSAALADAAAMEARQMLVNAAMCDDATAECRDAHNALVAALEGDLSEVQANEDATNAEVQAAQTALNEAKDARDAVATALADARQSTATGRAVNAAEAAANGLETARTADDIQGAEQLIADAEAEIAKGDDPDAYSDEIGAAKMAVARAKARNMVDVAVMAAEEAAGKLQDDQSKEAVEAARKAVTDARQAVTDNADDLTDADESGFEEQIAMAETPIVPLEKQMADADEAAQTEGEMRSAQMEAVTDAIAEADAAVMLLDENSTEDEIAKARMLVEKIQDAINDGALLLQPDIVGYNSRIAMLESDINTAETDMMARTERDNKARLASNAMSMKVAEAILDHELGMNVPAPFLVTSGDGTVNDLLISRFSGAAKVTPFQTEMDKENERFGSADAMDSESGWMSARFPHGENDDGMPEEEGVVYTNIGKAGHREWVEHLTSLNLTPDATTGVVTITTANAADVMGILPAGPIEDDSGSDLPLKAGQVYAGSYLGVNGNYVCTAACTVNQTKDGTVTINGGGVTFTPTIRDDETVDDVMVMYVVPDSDYLHFGYWKKNEMQKDGSYTHMIATFSNGSMAAITSGVDALRGSATYEGDAAGVYVHKNGLDEDDTLVVKNGTFTADASLTAMFGNSDGTEAVADLFSIYGTISNFENEDGGMIDNNWMLMLQGEDGKKRADLGSRDSGTGTISSHTLVGISGDTTGSPGARDGSWTATMFGNDGADTTDPLPDGALAGSDDHPTGIAGEFNGHFTNGHVAGAFGATKQ